MKYERPKEIILGQLLEGLNQAAGASGHMIHHHQDTRWFKTRAILEAVVRLVVAQSVEPLITPKKPEPVK